MDGTSPVKNSNVNASNTVKESEISATATQKIYEFLKSYLNNYESLNLDWYYKHRKTCEYMNRIKQSIRNGKSLEESIRVNTDNDIGIIDLGSFYYHYWKQIENGISHIGHGFISNRDYDAILNFSYEGRDFRQLNTDIILNPENEYANTMKWFEECKKVNGTKIYRVVINRFFSAVIPEKVSTVVNEYFLDDVIEDLGLEKGNQNWLEKNLRLMAMLPEPDDKFDIYKRGQLLWYFYVQISGAMPQKSQSKGIISNGLDRFYKFVDGKGFYFPEELINNYIFSLKTKPFVILSGISGTGKTKLAQLFAEYMCPDGIRRYCFISVRPDWNDNRGLLGFYNPITQQYQPTELLKLLLRASWDSQNPYFVILDEMNLAKVEYYFADFLSCMESRRIGDDRTIRQESIILHDHNEKLTFKDTDGTEYMIPQRLEIPLNVYFTGTINVDESTYMFSPKVLDRANVIEFNDVDMEFYSDKLFKKNKDEVESGIKATKEFIEYFTDGGRFCSRLIQKDISNRLKNCYNWLMKLNSILMDYHLHFGFRVVDEIMMYMTYSYEYYNDTLLSDFDTQMLQKVLPKLHGNRKQLEIPLSRLLRFCFNADTKTRTVLSDDEKRAVFKYNYADRIKELSDPSAAKFPDTTGTGLIREGDTAIFPRTAAKLCRMIDLLDKQGYTSFIE